MLFGLHIKFKHACKGTIRIQIGGTFLMAACTAICYSKSKENKVMVSTWSGVDPILIKC